MRKYSLLINTLISGSVLLSNLTVTAQSHIGRANKIDTALIKKAIYKTEEQLSLSVSKGDNEGSANCYTLDAKLMLPNFPAIVGRKSISAIYLAAKNAGEGSLIFSTISVWGNSKMIEEEGTYVLGSTQGKQLDKGKYISLWKQEGGKWRIFRCCLNSDLPTPVAK